MCFSAFWWFVLAIIFSAVTEGSSKFNARTKCGSHSTKNPSMTSTCAHTKCGPVVGSPSPKDPSMMMYLGIPYGAPPVGPNRWKPPLPAPCWTGTLNATSLGPMCWNMPPVLEQRAQSEDCLHLNVFTRYTNASQRVPVIFWIHGGSNVIGSNTLYPNVDSIAITKDVVVVSVNFRLGLLGFLALRELSEQDPRKVSGNYAILDIQLALRWVQDNIASFGGNPQSVTLLGQSSGGTNILSLLSSSASVGLFHRAISLSGSPNITMDIEQAEQQNRELFLPVVGCSPNATGDVLSCLYALSAEDISRLTPDCYNTPAWILPPEGRNGNGWCGLAIADGVTVNNLFDSLQHGLIDVPLILQTTHVETDYFAPDTYREMPLDQFLKFFQNWLISNGWNASAYQTWLNIYQDSLANTELLVFKFMADYMLACGNQVLSIWAGSSFSSPVYLGYVKYPPSHPYPSLFGTYPIHYAFHIWDYLAATGSWKGFLNIDDWTPQQSDVDFGELQLQMWIEFAYNGKIDTVHGWNEIDADPHFPNRFVCGVVHYPNNVTSVIDYQKYVCYQLQAPPLDIGVSFWVIN